jgi:hypothetical protein
MASAVSLASGVDVLREPFNNFTFAPWTVAGTPTITAGRNGNGASSTSTSNTVTYTIPAINESATLTLGFAYRTASVTSSSAAVAELCSDAAATTHNQLIVSNTGAVVFARGTISNTLATSAASTIAIDTWYYFEVQVTLGDSAAPFIVRLNGTVLLSGSADTKNAGTKTVYDSIRLKGRSGGFATLFDDLYLTMGAGAPFKGDITVP